MGKKWYGEDSRGAASISNRAPRNSRGATLIEFAIIFPLLVFLLVGIVECSWLFAQYLDVRHGAREGVRLATVNFPELEDPPVLTRTSANTSALLNETCDRMNVATGAAVAFTSDGDVGDPITVTAIAPGQTLTGLLNWVFPSTMSFSSTAVLHAEQEATWENTNPAGEPCP